MIVAPEEREKRTKRKKTQVAAHDEICHVWTDSLLSTAAVLARRPNDISGTKICQPLPVSNFNNLPCCQHKLQKNKTYEDLYYKTFTNMTVVNKSGT
jgi:hypothetical protein